MTISHLVSLSRLVWFRRWSGLEGLNVVVGPSSGNGRGNGIFRTVRFLWCVDVCHWLWDLLEGFEEFEPSNPKEHHQHRAVDNKYRTQSEETPVPNWPKVWNWCPAVIVAPVVVFFLSLSPLLYYCCPLYCRPSGLCIVGRVLLKVGMLKSPENRKKK